MDLDPAKGYGSRWIQFRIRNPGKDREKNVNSGLFQAKEAEHVKLGYKASQKVLKISALSDYHRI